MSETLSDNYIIELFWRRDELAVKEIAAKYGHYCTKIAMNILVDARDAEEAVNDTYLQAWNSMPPARPDSLSAYVGKITRNLSINKYNARNTQKRRASEYALSLEELGECIPQKVSADSDGTLNQCINGFLQSQKQEHRMVFVCRYFYCDCIAEIAKRFNRSESKIKSTLFRMRNKLKNYLEDNYE